MLFHQGASGNQSPRHVTRTNTFEEAQRIGEIVGRNIADVLAGVGWHRAIRVNVCRATLELAPGQFPEADAAARRVAAATARFAELKTRGAARQLVRTAECDMFGAEETAELARAVGDGRLAAAISACLPAEIQSITLGPWNFVGWPGEFFVEYALEVRRRAPGTFVITMANGELQGYIVTEEAAARGFYEAANAVFAPSNGPHFVQATLALVGAKQ